MKHVIKTIDDTSPLRRKVQPGDELVAINGHRLIDVLDYKYYSYEKSLVLQLVTGEGKIKLVGVRKPEGRDLGLEFETYLMDRPRSCANNCIFCFVDQMPQGMRKSLYFKDDDARLSFLMGCYITLTNLSKREVQRIIDLHVSPVNVSVHTMDPELRCRMLKNPRAGESIDIMRRFAEAGITMNCQIVCCPGYNDGAALEHSMRELRRLHPAVHSVSIVPVGLTKYREGLEKLTPFTPEHARETIEQVTAFGDGCLRDVGERIFYCSDEMYLTAGLPLPEDEFYGEHSQLENGVGLLSLMQREFILALKMSDGADGAPFSVACGESIAPYMENLLCTAREKYGNINGRVYAIENDFFGRSVNVSGLITGRDLVAQLRGRELGERLFVSQNMLRRDELDFLDDMTIEQAEAALGVPIYPVEEDGGELCDAMLGILPERRAPKRDTEQTEYCNYNQPADAKS
jgi:putative radical SAM enzyme (TIGR03279 family)